MKATIKTEDGVWNTYYGDDIRIMPYEGMIRVYDTKKNFDVITPTTSHIEIKKLP